MRKIKGIISSLIALTMLVSMMAVSVNAAAPTAVSLSKITSGTKATYVNDQTFEGKSGLLKLSNTTGDGRISFEWCSVGMQYYKYLLVDCYYAPAETTEATDFSLNAIMCKLNETWYTTDTSVDSNCYGVGTSPANQWTTAVIDVEHYFTWAMTNHSTKRLQQFYIYPPALTGDDAFYISGVRFASYLEEPQVYTDDSGKYTYVSEDASVTVDGQSVSAFKTIKEAVTALGADGGTIYIEGTITAFKDVETNRGDILIRGLGDDEEAIASNILDVGTGGIVVRGGNTEFDYLTIKDANVETNNPYAPISTWRTVNLSHISVTLGSHLATDKYAAIGSRQTDNTERSMRTDSVIINGGKYYAVTPLSSYGSIRNKRYGNVDYTLNDGEFNVVLAGSNNSWEWEQSKIYGDVNFTFNGGLYHNMLVMGSAYGGSLIDGNIIWTINGGVMDHRTIKAGNTNTARKEALQNDLNNTAAIVNLKTAAEGVANLTLGTANAKGLEISGDEIYILNNNELNCGTKIADGSLAEYKFHVYYGSAEPVFAMDKTVNVNGEAIKYGGALTGFKLTADEEGAVPYLNGVALTANEDGIYEISENTSDVIEIVFAKEKMGVISFAAGTDTANAKVFNFDEEAQMPMEMYVAKYLGEELVSVELKPISVSYGENIQVFSSEAVSKEEGYTYKAFLWNEMTPLANSLGL